MAKRVSFDFNLFRAMEVFVAVVETRQVTQAANLLGMTQSAASQHLRNLEQSLGTKLIDRSSRPIELTRAGVSLHRRATTILDEIEDLTFDFRQLEAAPLPMLRIGMLASIATTLTPHMVQLAKQRFAIQELVLHAGLASDHESLLRAKQADLVITSDAFYDMDGLERHHVLREAFLLVLPKSYDGPKDDLQEIANRLPLVRFTGNTPVGRRTEQHLRRIRLELPRVIAADRSSMLTAAVTAGHGFSILTPTLLIDGLTENMALDVRPLPATGFSRSITLVSRSQELGGLPQIFAQQSAEVLKAHIGHHFGDLAEEAILPDAQ